MIKLFQHRVILGVSIIIFFLFLKGNTVEAATTSLISVSPYKVWNIKFNQAVDDTSLYSLDHKPRITVTDSDGNQISGVAFIRSKDQKSVIVFPPPGGYIPGPIYSLNIKRSITALTGTSLADDVKMTFTSHIISLLTLPNGDKYNGDIVNGKAEGYGSIAYMRNNAYIGCYLGEMHDNLESGYGNLIWEDGNSYYGEFTNGNDDVANFPNGYGQFIWANTNKYLGSFSNGKMNGQGTYVWPNGDIYSGKFKYHEPSEGTLTFANGSKYVGQFTNWTMNGQGNYTYVDGTVKSGLWQNGVFVDPNSNNDDTINTLGNSSNNIQFGGFASGQGDWVYYVGVNDELRKTKSDGSQTVKLVNGKVSNINVIGDWIYYIKNDSDYFIRDQIYKVKSDGTNETKLSTNETSGLTAYKNWLYYIDNNTSDIFRMDYNGQNNTRITNTSYLMKLFYIVNDQIIYVVDKTGKNSFDLYKMNLNGSSSQRINWDAGQNFDGCNLLDFYGIDGNSIYVDYYMNDMYGSHTDYGIGKIDLTTGFLTKLWLKFDEGIYKGTVYNGWLYYQSGGQGFIYKRNLSGGGATGVYAPVDPVYDVFLKGQTLNIVGDWLYSSDEWRIKFDGSQFQKLP